MSRGNPGFSRRDFLKLAATTVGAAAGAAMLSACNPGGAAPADATKAAASRGPLALGGETAALAPSSTPKPRKLCFVLWDHQLARYGFEPRDRSTPLPETCPLYSGAANVLTPAWQAYWKGILHVCNPDVPEKQFEGAWQSLIATNRAFTNTLEGAPHLLVLHSLTCGGATHEMVTGVPEGLYMRIYTLNYKKGPPPIPGSVDDIDITRHFFATTGSDVRLADGSYAVYGFPQFENCIVPLVSTADTDLLEISRIKVVTEIQRPYHTEPDEKRPTATPSSSR
jgi:hypothetical protein